MHVQGRSTPFAIVQVLQAMGVQHDAVSLDKTKGILEFEWPGAPSRKSKVIFIKHDLRESDTELNRRLAGTVRVYFERAGMTTVQHHEDYLPEVAEWLDKQGSVVISPVGSKGEDSRQHVFYPHQLVLLGFKDTTPPFLKEINDELVKLAAEGAQSLYGKFMLIFSRGSMVGDPKSRPNSKAARAIASAA